MLKVVEIIPTLNVDGGGAEILFSQLVESMSNREDVELYVICLYSGISKRFSYLLSNSKIHFTFLNKKIGFDFKSAKELKKAINKINPDVIHYHLGCTISYFLAFGFRKKKWKTFCTVHSIPQEDENKVGRYLRKRYAKKGLIRFIGISSLIANESLKFYKIKECPVVYNSIKLDSNRCLDVDKKYDFVCVAVFKPAKNHRLLFEAFEEIQLKHKDVNLLCVGGGELFEESKQYVKEHALNVQFAGWQNDVSPFLKQSKNFVLSSRFEGLPISILEAMQYGLPIIAPNVGGIPDIVKDGINGYLYETSNKDALIHSMEQSLLADNNEQISKNNFVDIEKYSIETCVDNYIKIFKGESHD